uniref:Uncharacterized protein n=1 Tax=Anopheles atroparvus TaxID=41427 RepID=A0A182J6M7_ANOAO
MEVVWIFSGNLALLCCVLLRLGLSLAITDNVLLTPATTTTKTTPFPVFLRSRFNPRMVETNEIQPKLLLASSEEEPIGPSKPIFQPKWSLSFPTSTTTSLPDLDPVVAVSTSTVYPASTTVRSAEEHQQSTTVDPLDSDECGIDSGTGDDFPWIAVLEHGGPDQTSGRKRTLSKGVLIDRQHVLTTVSSVQNSYPSWVLTGVRLGDTPTHREGVLPSGKRTPAGNSTLVRIPIGMVFLHESKDIALIRLAGDGVQHLSDHVRPICLPKEDHRLEAFALSSHVCEKQPTPSVVHSRTASSNRRNSRSRLQPVELLAGDDCNRLLAPYGARLVGKSFCAWENATDTCTGPLGGPIVAKIRGKYHVVGLRSYLQTETEVDGSELPSIYIRIGGFRKWVSAVIRAIHN